MIVQGVREEEQGTGVWRGRFRGTKGIARESEHMTDEC